MATSKIAVTASNDKYFIWNAHDIMKLRQEHRIVGHLVGSHVQRPFQNGDLGVPLELSRFELKVLADRELVELVKVDRAAQPDENLLRTFEESKEKQWQEYKERIIEEKKAKLMENSKSVIEVTRKRRKLSDDVTDEQIMQEKFAHIDVPVDQKPVQILATCPFKQFISSTNLPSLSDDDLYKFKIYQHLYNSGFFLTNGFKFAVDFLAYDGDPMVNHAKYMVWVTKRAHQLDSFELLIKARLSVQVNKTLLMASLNDKDEPTFVSVNWKGRRYINNNQVNLI